MTHWVFTDKGIAIRCGRCLTVASSGPNLKAAWNLWKQDGHDIMEHKGIRVVEKVVLRTEILCPECGTRLSENDEVDGHLDKCREQLRERVRTEIRFDQAMGIESPSDSRIRRPA